MKSEKASLIRHYKNLWFFNFNRLKDNNYKDMREYLAGVFLSDIEEFIPLTGKKVLDVGGARGELCKVINEKRGCEAVNLDPTPYEYGEYSSDFIWKDTVAGVAEDMPFKDNEFDLVICRGVFEHIFPEKQQISLDEMFRVTRPGGYCYITIPPWYNPCAGHGLKPFHYLPFKLSKFMAQKAYGKKIKENSWRERRLFRITFRSMLKMISSSGFKLVETEDVHFRMHVLTKIPILRDIAVPAVAFILSKS
ncbi:MAG: methyltransferase domain-containing protein [Candidatus Omnitrophota bacterium]